MEGNRHTVERRKILQIATAPADLVGVWRQDDGTIFTAPVDCLALVEIREADYDFKGHRLTEWKLDEYGPRIEPFQNGEIGFESMCESGNFMCSVRSERDAEQLAAIGRQVAEEYQAAHAPKS